MRGLRGEEFVSLKEKDEIFFSSSLHFFRYTKLAKSYHYLEIICVQQVSLLAEKSTIMPR